MQSFQPCYARIGIISDDRVQQHTLKTVLERLGFNVVLNAMPEKLSQDDSLYQSDLDLWLVDLFSEDEEHLDWLDQLLDAGKPVLLGAGKMPPQGDEEHPRWEKRLFSKLKGLLPENKLQVVSEQSLEQLQQSFNAADIIPNAPEAGLKLPSEFEGIGAVDEPFICVLGASLGGPEAVKEFLDYLPSGLPVAFVYAQHIDERFEDVLIQTIGRHSEYSMVKAEADAKLKAGDILLASVGQEFKFTAESTLNMCGTPWPGPYGPSVDQVMLNVWQHFKHESLFLLFSGMGNDGADACSLIAKQGGKVWAQESSTCANSSMPDSAVETGYVSCIGNPHQLAVQLIKELSVRWQARVGSVS